MTAAVGRYRKPSALVDRALGLGARHAVVEASAGTGKTYLLEHLVVDLLLTREVPLPQILVVTFTEKATAELVDRIRRKLEELAALTGDHPNAAGAPDEDCWRIDDRARRRLRDALFAFDRAAISTIHAFCQRLLREHAFLNRRLFDEQAVDEEQAFESAFAEVLRRDLSEGSPARRLLGLWLAGGNDLGKVRRAVLNAHRKLAGSTGDPAQALRPALDELGVLAAAAAVIARPPELVKAALKAEKVHGTTANTVERRLNTLLAKLTGPVAARDLIAIAAGVKNAEASTDKFFDKLEDYFDDNPRSATLQSLRGPIDTLIGATDPLGLLVAHLLPAVARRLESSKRESGLFDFQDMLTLVARSLEGEGEGARALLATLRARYRHALIDEFQDTDEVQWDIFRRIFFDSGDGHVLTVIGDPKQAIYGFRGADVFTYLNASRAITAAGGASLPLTENFRSTRPLIDAYNAILDQHAPFFRAETGIRYDHPVTCGRPELALVDGGGRPAPGVVVLDLESDKQKLLTFEVKRALLDRMAREIQGLVTGGQPLAFGPAGAGAPIRPGDIYVLTRTTRESREVGDVLRAARVPFAYFKQE
jgi:exodeoxyribonuclease V beta subunit